MGLNYCVEDNELIERLGIDDLVKKTIQIDFDQLRIRWVDIYGHVDSIDFYYNFINKIENSIDEDNNKKEYIKYDDVTDKYYYISIPSSNSKSLAWEIDFPKDNYIVSNTLHELYLKSINKENKIKYIEDKEQARKNIISKMDNGFNYPTLAEARIYLDYLENLKRENNKTIRKDSTGLVLFSSIGPVSFIGTLCLTNSLEIGSFLPYLMSTLAGIITTYNVDNYLAEKGYENTFIGSSILKYDKEKINKIKRNNKDNKIINSRIKKLYTIDNIDKVVITDYSSIEELNVGERKQLDSLHLNNSILRDLDELVNQISFLDSNNKKVYYSAVQELLSEYCDRYQNIINQDSNSIDIERDDYYNLKSYMIGKITDLELKIIESKQKNVSIKEIIDEKNLLSNKINELSQLNDSDEVNINRNKKVKVKKLKDNIHKKD